jgi:hypothetical protein
VKFSVRQILASAAGAVLAAIIASSFGVKGTIIGVAIGSTVATIGTALVAQSIERGHEAVKQVVVRAPDTSTLLRKLGGTGASGDAASTQQQSGAPTGAVAAASRAGDDTVEMASTAASLDEGETLEVSAVTDAPPTEVLEASTTPVRPGDQPTGALRTRRFSWSAIAGTAAVVFVVALMFVTAVELIAGKPLASLFGDTGGGTTVKNIFVPSPAPTTTPSTTTTSTTSPAATTTTTSPSGTSTTTSTTAPTTRSTTTTTTGAGATTTTTSSGPTTTSTTTSTLPG